MAQDGPSMKHANVTPPPAIGRRFTLRGHKLARVPRDRPIERNGETGGRFLKLILQIGWQIRSWLCFNPALSSDLEGFFLHKVISFVATMGLILATVAGMPHFVSAANRRPRYLFTGLPKHWCGLSLRRHQHRRRSRGFAVVQAPSSVLVVPTTRIPGIESPALLSENARNYWEAAWDARRFVEEGARRRLPRDKIGMAINSPASRS
jgi:CDP-diacylglycerol pyrophosphatase